MELVVDLARVTVVLADADDVARLGVRVGEPPTASDASEEDVHRLHDVLVAANVGRLLDGRQALVRADAVRFHAAGQVGEDWEGAFEALCRRQLASTDGSAEPELVAPVRWP